MHLWSKATLKTLLVPGGILLLGVALLVYSGWLTLALPALSFLYYCALIGGMLLAWRFHSSRMFFALLVLFLAGQAVGLSGAGRALPGTPEWTALRAVALLVPLNFVLIAADAGARVHHLEHRPRRFVSVRAIGDCVACSAGPLRDCPRFLCARITLQPFPHYRATSCSRLLARVFFCWRGAF